MARQRMITAAMDSG